MDVVTLGSAAYAVRDSCLLIGGLLLVENGIRDVFKFTRSGLLGGLGQIAIGATSVAIVAGKIFEFNYCPKCIEHDK